MRGIIANCEFEGSLNSLLIKSSSIDPIKLREYLLYWDKIDFPTNNVIYIESSPEEKYLEEVGVLQRSHTIFGGEIIMNPKVFIESQLRAFEINNSNKGQIWSIAQPTKNIILPSDKCVTSRNIQVELYDCIPVPSANVSLDDILNFKEHRYDELLEFRSLLDKMYDSIRNNADADFSKNKCIEMLQNKVIEINRVMDESKIKRFLNSIKVELDITELIKSGLKLCAGYEIGKNIGFLLIGSALGLASATINIKSEFSLKPNAIPAELKDYAYLFYQSRELI